MRGVEMLHQEQGHAAGGRDGRQRPVAGVQPAGRRTDGDDGKLGRRGMALARSVPLGRPGRLP
jgi:hypothetical protein